MWFDAPIGYISATKAWAAKTGHDWKKYWCDEETQLVHFIGKDNIVFHCIIFPVMLKAHGNFILPTNVPANEFLNLEGDKMSTSRGWSIEMHEFLAAFPDKTDELRYYLTAIAPETKDADFTWKGFQTANKSELVDILGNYINRIVTLTHKFYDGSVPMPDAFQATEETLKGTIREQVETVHKLLENYRFRDAQFEMMNLARAGNKYLADLEPWKLNKTDAVRTRTIMFCGLQLGAHLAHLMQYFMPGKAAELFEMLKLQPTIPHAETFEYLSAGHTLGEATLLFRPIEDEKIEAQITLLQQRIKPVTSPAVSYKPMKQEINIDDFGRTDLRTGTITSAEKVEKTDKLLKLTIDLGFETRTVLSGIAMHYKPEEIIGQQVVVVANLAPKTMRGIESHGMILMAENAEGKLVFVQPSETFQNGAMVK